MLFALRSSTCSFVSADHGGSVPLSQPGRGLLYIHREKHFVRYQCSIYLDLNLSVFPRFIF